MDVTTILRLFGKMVFLTAAIGVVVERPFLVVNDEEGSAVG